jgi:hypothetical protein
VIHLRSAIEKAKERLPLPQLLRALGFSPPRNGEGNIKSPFVIHRRHKSPSFSIYRHGQAWGWCDRTGGREIKGDEITLLEKLENLSRSNAIARYLALAGINNARDKRGRLRDSPRPRRNSKSASELSGGLIDWPSAVTKFSAKHAVYLAKWRGYSQEFVEWLRDHELVGIYKDNLALPVHDDGRRVIAAHVRTKGGRWFYAPRGAGCQPLIIGEIRGATSTMVFESQWDAFAVMDQCGWHHEQPDGWAVLITRGASNGRFAARATGEIYAWPQNDPERDGKRAGEEWLLDVALHASGKVFRVAVPEEFKDANDWVRAAA